MSDLLMRSVAGAVLASLLASTTAMAQPSTTPAVSVSQGILEGVQQGEVDAFLGIPYAAPPVGQNRWRAPQTASAWEGTRKAEHFGANCIQTSEQGTVGPWTHEYVITDNFDEDCLFLNVWRPGSAQGGAKWPVLVWIHGGGFSVGSGAVPIYDGRNLATKGIVVVSMNYRLGPLGFLALPELTREAGDEPAANFGMYDQIAALKWVQENIAAFGGDPDKVTIAGQSAGSMAVHTLVASPLASGLFRQGIAQSGLPAPGRVNDLQAAEQTGLAYMEQLGVNSLAEMRALPAERFLPMPGQPRTRLRFGVAVDGRLLPEGPAEMVMSGRANDVAMIVGQTADDFVLGFDAPSDTLTEEAWRKALEETFQADAETMGALYPAETDHERAEAQWQMKLDKGLASIWLWGDERAVHNESLLYVYLWAYVEPGPQSGRWGAFHSSEIPYIFGTLDSAPERGFTFADWNVSLTISDLWVNFVKTGTPSAPGAPAWPPFHAGEPQFLRIDETDVVLPLLTPEKRAAYRSYVAKGGSLSPF